MRTKSCHQRGVWRYWGRMLLTLAIVSYQFQLDVNNLALVIIFNFKKIWSLVVG